MRDGYVMDPWRYSTDGISVALRVTPRGGRDDIDGIETLANGRSVVKVRVRVAEEVAKVKREHRLTPGLAVVLVGSDPASEVYVRSKHTQTQAAGMASFEHKLPP